MVLHKYGMVVKILEGPFVKTRAMIACFCVFSLAFIPAVPCRGKPYPWEAREKKTPEPPGPEKKPGAASPEVPSSARALFREAHRLYLGKGVQRDYARAYELYARAARQGYAPAQYMAGVCREYGQGTAKDLDKAYRYYLLGAKQGYARAEIKVGLFYWHGRGRPKDYAEAVKWFSLAARQGSKTGLNNMGAAYEFGYGTRKDPQIALSYYERAARKGNAKGYENLVRLCGKLGKPVPPIEGRVRFGVYDLKASKYWSRVPIPKDTKEKQWIMGYARKKGGDPDPLILFHAGSFGFTNETQRRILEKKISESMRPKSQNDIRHMKVARHRTIVIRDYDGEDTSFTLLPRDDISYHLVIVLYAGKDVARLTPEVRAYLSTLVFRGD